MDHYIEYIIQEEQKKFIVLLCEKYGELGNFTPEIIQSKFLVDTTLCLVNDEFKVPGKRGRPRKE